MSMQITLTLLSMHTTYKVLRCQSNKIALSTAGDFDVWIRAAPFSALEKKLAQRVALTITRVNMPYIRWVGYLQTVTYDVSHTLAKLQLISIWSWLDVSLQYRLYRDCCLLDVIRQILARGPEPLTHYYLDQSLRQPVDLLIQYQETDLALLTRLAQHYQFAFYQSLTLAPAKRWRLVSRASLKRQVPMKIACVLDHGLIGDQVRQYASPEYHYDTMNTRGDHLPDHIHWQLAGLPTGLASVIDFHRSLPPYIVSAFQFRYHLQKGAKTTLRLSHGESLFLTAQQDEAPRQALLNGLFPATVAEQMNVSGSLDTQGYYRVYFDFDYNYCRSQPLPQLQSYGTPSGRQVNIEGAAGRHFPLPIGTRVAVIFIEGDENKPAIVGVLPDPNYLAEPNDTTKASLLFSQNSGLSIEDDEKTYQLTLKQSSQNSLLFGVTQQQGFMYIDSSLGAQCLSIKQDYQQLSKQHYYVQVQGTAWLDCPTTKSLTQKVGQACHTSAGSYQLHSQSGVIHTDSQFICRVTEKWQWHCQQDLNFSSQHFMTLSALSGDMAFLAERTLQITSKQAVNFNCGLSRFYLKANQGISLHAQQITLDAETVIIQTKKTLL